MIRTSNPRTLHVVALLEPLTRDELIERIYVEGHRLIGTLAVPIPELFATCGTAEAEALLVRSFVGDAPVGVVLERLLHQRGAVLVAQVHRDQTRLMVVVELLIDLERLDVDWDHIDDDTPIGEDGRPESFSFHRHAARPVGWLLPAQDPGADDAG